MTHEYKLIPARCDAIHFYLAEGWAPYKTPFQIGDYCYQYVYRVVDAPCGSTPSEQPTMEQPTMEQVLNSRIDRLEELTDELDAQVDRLWGRVDR